MKNRSSGDFTLTSRWFLFNWFKSSSFTSLSSEATLRMESFRKGTSGKSGPTTNYHFCSTLALNSCSDGRMAWSLFAMLWIWSVILRLITKSIGDSFTVWTSLIFTTWSNSSNGCSGPTEVLHSSQFAWIGVCSMFCGDTTTHDFSYPSSLKLPEKRKGLTQGIVGICTWKDLL